MELEIKHNTGAWTSVGQMELLSLSQTEMSQAAGSLTFSYETAIAGDYRFSATDTIQLRGRNSSADSWKTLFSGVINASPERSFGKGSAEDEVIAYDVWSYLERTAYLVAQFTAESYNKSHVILFRDADGERMTTGEQIKAVLDYAISVGAPIQYVAADLTAMTVEPPADEQSDMSCSEIILKALRWQADIFTQFDYTTTPPTLRFFDSTDELSLVINITDCLVNAGGISVQRHDDKSLRGVVIYYEIENQIIDGTTQEVRSDSVGETSGPNVLVHTCSLDGSYVQNDSQSINLLCGSIPSNWRTNFS